MAATAITNTFRFSGAGEDFGPRADGIITAHTTQGPYNRLTVADAIILARWQDRPDIAGSYNDLVCIDGVLSCVPPEHASGGINPGSAGFKPRSWLYGVLDADEIRNPNYFTRNVAFMGDMYWFDKNGWPPAMIDRFARIWIEEEQRIRRKAVFTEHADFQPPPNRFDAGPIATRLIKARYAELTGQSAQGSQMADIDTFKLETIRIDGSANIRSAPSDAADLLFTTDKPSSAVSVGTKDGFHAYWIEGQKQWGYTSTQHNVLSREPFGGTVEVIKEVPTGLTQLDLQKAVKAEKERIALAEANRIRNT
jgi:hypothetical protein